MKSNTQYSLLMGVIDTINPAISVIDSIACAMEYEAFDTLQLRYGLSQAIDMAINQIKAALEDVNNVMQDLHSDHIKAS